MDIRQSGIANTNLHPVNAQKMSFLGIGKEAGLPFDTFTSSAESGEKLLSPDLAKFTKQVPFERADRNAIGGTDAVAVSPEKQAYDVIAANAKDTKEAEADFKRFSGMLEKDMDPREMADFFVYGDKFYKKDNESRDQLIKVSLEELHNFISDKENSNGGTTRPERRECAKILIDAIAPSDQEYLFFSNDVLRPFSSICDILDDKKTETASFHFGDENVMTEFSPPGKVAPGIVEATKMFAGWMKILQHAKNRSSPKYQTNDDTYGLGTLKIVRSHLHYDPEKTKELESLMSVVGSPWSSLGIMIKLDTVQPGLRDKAKTAILQESGKEGTTEANVAEITNQLVGIYSILQPGMERMLDNTPLSKLPLPSRVQIADDQLKLMEKYRENGESITDSCLRFDDFSNKMEGMGIPLNSVKDFNRLDGFYGMLGEKKADLLDGIPGAKTFQDVNKNVLRIMEQVRAGNSVPAEQAPDIIKLGMQMRRPGQTLEDTCKMLAEDYKTIGDLTKLEKIGKQVDQGIKDGSFKDTEWQKVKDEIIYHFKTLEMMGDHSKETLDTAFEEVLDAHIGKSGEQAIKKSDDFVIIGGVKLDVKKRD